MVHVVVVCCGDLVWLVCGCEGLVVRGWQGPFCE